MNDVNPNIHIPHGDGPSVSDATGSVVITEAEKSALGNTSVEKENKTPSAEMMNSDIHISQGVAAAHSYVASPAAHEGASAFQSQAETNAPAEIGRNKPCPCGSGNNHLNIVHLNPRSFPNGVPKDVPQVVLPPSGGNKAVGFIICWPAGDRGAGAFLTDDPNTKEPTCTWELKRTPKDGEPHVFYKVEFDLATRKVLDVKEVKPDTSDPDRDLKLENCSDPDALAKIQACLDMPENGDVMDDLEMVVRANNDPYCYLSTEIPQSDKLKTATLGHIHQIGQKVYVPCTTNSGESFVSEGTPGENGEIELKTITQEEYDKVRFIDLFVFHSPAGPEGDCPDHNELVCRASNLDEAVSIFIRYCPKVGLTADICKARVDLTTGKVLDAEQHFCRQMSPTDVEVTYDAPWNFGAKEKEKLIEDIQGYFDSHPQRRIYVDAFQQDPEVQVVACLGKEFNPDSVLIISTFASEKQKGV